MYIPRLFRNTDEEEVLKFIEDNSFAVLVSQGESRVLATHIPLYLSKNSNGELTLTGHISKANEAWKTFKEGKEVLAIFSGSHAYVSPSWYAHENVPTWNYIAVHVYGALRIIEGEELRNALRLLVDKYERGSEKPVSVDRMSAGMVEREMKGIVGFEILVTEIQPAYKLSQNRDARDHANIVRELKKTGHADAHEIARQMEKKSPE